MYIEKINGPQDVKKLSIDELNALASEMRDALLHRASVHGGHFGPIFHACSACAVSFSSQPSLRMIRTNRPIPCSTTQENKSATEN